MYLIGLTGSIGMGKSATGQLFIEAGVPVYDADAAVHALYEKGGAAVAPIGALVPEAIVDGAVDRAILGQYVLKDGDKLKHLEAIVHPLAGQSQFDFLTKAMADNAPLVVLDIPLLFETGGDGFVDSVVVVSAPFAMQKKRVLARDGMNEARFLDILAKQTPDEEKRQRADFIVDSSISIADARTQVHAILAALEGKSGAAYEARLARFEAAEKDKKQEKSG
jgi:dephospho-CoA kinase